MKLMLIIQTIIKILMIIINIKDAMFLAKLVAVIVIIVMNVIKIFIIISFKVCLMQKIQKNVMI